MADTPTPSELARDLDELRRQRTEDLAQRHKDVELLSREVREVGSRIEARIDGLHMVAPDTFKADQARQDDAIAATRSQLSTTNRLLVGLVLALVAGGVGVVQVVGG